LVAAVADDVDTVSVGDRVFGSAFLGAFAEQIAIAAASVEQMPDGASFAEAAENHLDDVYGYLSWFTGDRAVADDRFPWETNPIAVELRRRDELGIRTAQLHLEKVEIRPIGKIVHVRRFPSSAVRIIGREGTGCTLEKTACG